MERYMIDISAAPLWAGSKLRGRLEVLQDILCLLGYFSWSYYLLSFINQYTIQLRSAILVSCLDNSLFQISQSGSLAPSKKHSRLI